MIINKLNVLNRKKHIGDIRQNVLTTTRGGLAINPLASYNPVSLTSIANNTVPTQSEYSYVGGDTQSFTYDFGTKVASSVAECPLKIYSQDVDLASLPNPTTGWTEVTSQSKIDRLKAQNNVPFSGSVNQADYTYTYNSVTYDDNTVSVVDDFVGKVANSTVENPNISKGGTNTSLNTITTWNGIGEVSQNNGYDKIKNLDGNVVNTLYTSVNGNIPQQLFSFNLIRIIEDKFGEIPATDKVQWLKNNLKVVAFKWYGFGSCPSGNKACLSYCYNGIWQAPLIHTNSTVTNRTIYYSIPSDFTGSIQSDGFIHYIAYTDASDGATASTIYTDYVSIEVTLKCPNNYGTNNPMTSNYLNKVSGSTTENPNSAKAVGNMTNSLYTPSQFTYEVGTADYGYMSVLNNSSYYAQATSSGNIPQHLFSFNLIQIVERKLGYSIPASDKVAWLKENVSKIKINWYGYGSYPSGNKAYIKIYNAYVSAWAGGSVSNTSSSPTFLSDSWITTSISQIIDSSGFSHFLAYTDASDGVTASTIYTDYVEIVVTLKSNRLLTPTNTRRDGTKGEVLVVNEQDFSVSKLYDGSALGGYAITTNKAKAYLVEVDLTAVCNGLYGGSLASMKSAMKSLRADVWAKGNGSSSGLSTNGARGKVWTNDANWSSGIDTTGFWVGENLTSNIVNFNFLGGLTTVDPPRCISTGNKVYVILYSKYASDGTIPSTLDLDFLSVRVDFTRVVDVPSTKQVVLPPYWSMLVKGFSPNWENYSKVDFTRLMSIGLDDSNYFQVEIGSNKLRLRKKLNGSTVASISSSTTTNSKYQVHNIFIEQTPTTMKMKILKNNGAVEVLSVANTSTLTGIMTLQPLNYSSNSQADAFFESITLFNRNFDDTSAETLLRGNQPLLSNKELFDINQLPIPPNMTISNGIVTLNATEAYQGSYLDIPVLPNNKYELQGIVTGTGGYIDVSYRYNSIVLSYAASIITTSVNTITLTTPSNCNKVRIYLGNTQTGTFTYKNISLKLKM